MEVKPLELSAQKGRRFNKVGLKVVAALRDAKGRPRPAGSLDPCHTESLSS